MLNLHLNTQLLTRTGQDLFQVIQRSVVLVYGYQHDHGEKTTADCLAYVLDVGSRFGQS